MDPDTLTTAVAALAAVLGLVVLVARVLRRFGLAPAVLPDGPRRLGIVETLPIAGRRQLMLLRCDGHHILLLSGGAQDIMLALPGEAP